MKSDTEREESAPNLTTACTVAKDRDLKLLLEVEGWPG